jgi:hypothetical protein
VRKIKFIKEERENLMVLKDTMHCKHVLLVKAGRQQAREGVRK